MNVITAVGHDYRRRFENADSASHKARAKTLTGQKSKKASFLLNKILMPLIGHEMTLWFLLAGLHFVQQESFFATMAVIGRQPNIGRPRGFHGKMSCTFNPQPIRC
jgi:hypothetical protein